MTTTPELADFYPWELLASMPAVMGLDDNAELVGAFQDFAALLDVEGVLDRLSRPDHQRA